MALKEYEIQGTLKFRHSIYLHCVDLNSHNLKVESSALLGGTLGLEAWETTSQVTLGELLP